MPSGYCHLAQSERCQIFALRKSGFSLREIAKEVGFPSYSQRADQDIIAMRSESYVKIVVGAHPGPNTGRRTT